MKIVVLGGAGAMGRVTVMDLVNSSDAEKIVIADGNVTAAQALADKLHDKRISVEQLDASVSTNIDRVLRDADVVANCLHHNFNLIVMDSALRTETHYLDLGGLYNVTKQQLELNNEWKKAGITAISGMGSSPGTTNIMAAFAVDKLDAVDSVHIRFGSVSFKKEVNRALSLPYHISTIMDEYSVLSPIFENGDWKLVAPLSGEEEIIFPDPIGKAKFFNTIHSETLTFPLSFKEKGIKDVSFKIALPAALADKVRFLVGLGFAGEEKIAISGTEVAPREFLTLMYNRLPQDNSDPNDFGMIRVIVTGEAKGSKCEIIMETGCGADLKDWGVGSGAYRTGMPLSIVAQMLAKGEITEKGVFAPEKCVPVKKYFEELGKRGMVVYSTVKRAEA
ncbi:MAG: saccharopine dehydrogenase NADP-binding domain-containing protein [Parabacteroides sp.]|nr:saccharopine dehydrogenase NADP-binding domain-containing protein [Eubacteriales bacterium]MDD4591114.1 saccharopine dehydrogenase NADP-binding domain-containing protein [Parabacteroides sp.]